MVTSSEIAFDQFFERMLNDYRIGITFGSTADPEQQLKEQARIIWNAAWQARGECECEHIKPGNQPSDLSGEQC